MTKIILFMQLLGWNATLSIFVDLFLVLKLLFFLGCCFHR